MVHGSSIKHYSGVGEPLGEQTAGPYGDCLGDGDCRNEKRGIRINFEPHTTPQNPPHPSVLASIARPACVRVRWLKRLNWRCFNALTLPAKCDGITSQDPTPKEFAGDDTHNCYRRPLKTATVSRIRARRKLVRRIGDGKDASKTGLASLGATKDSFWPASGLSSMASRTHLRRRVSRSATLPFFIGYELGEYTQFSGQLGEYTQLRTIS